MTLIAKLPLNTVVQRNEAKFLANALDDEIVMMDMDNGDYLGINSVGADIWTILAGPVTVGDLVAKMMDLYEVSEEQCTTEVNTFLNKMMENDMLIVEG